MTGHLIPSTRVVGYAYGAAEHCLACAAAAGTDAESATDRDGNVVGAIFSGEVAAISRDDCLRSFCGLCGALIEASRCTNCRTAFGGGRS
jgi:hypothetical protein